jgi:hypothetical protein
MPCGKSVSFSSLPDPRSINLWERYSAGIEGIMFLSHGIWVLRTRKMRKKAKEQGVAFDELPEAVEWEGEGYDVSFGRMWRAIKGMFRHKAIDDIENHV